MKLSDFDYDLPQRFIAQTPIPQRDHSKLMVYDRSSGKVELCYFFEITKYLRPGDVLVVNNTRVLPARLFGVKEGTGARIEFLLLKKISLDTYSTLIKPLKRVKTGSRIIFSSKLTAEIIEKDEESGTATIKFISPSAVSIEELLEELGTMPLPHYITRKMPKKNRERYQTIYNSVKGSVAAPTAGLHWTPELIESVKQRGVLFCELTLHVGLGTFKPVKTEQVQDHQMHAEYFEIPKNTADIINLAKKEGRRVICVGTTSMRTLEGAASKSVPLKSQTGETNIFIYPPYNFKIADCLVTNFHLPKSTLLMLVSAFVGELSIKKVLELYETAKQNDFRFFSFGDAMFII